MKTLRCIVLFIGCTLFLQRSANAQSNETFRVSGFDRLTNGTVRLEVRGAPGTAFTVEFSSDLRDWHPFPGPQFVDWGLTNYLVNIYTLDAEGAAVITDEKTRGASAGFYRARKFP